MNSSRYTHFAAYITAAAAIIVLAFVGQWVATVLLAAGWAIAGIVLWHLSPTGGGGAEAVLSDIADEISDLVAEVKTSNLLSLANSRADLIDGNADADGPCGRALISAARRLVPAEQRTHSA